MRPNVRAETNLFLEVRTGFAPVYNSFADCWLNLFTHVEI